ncbi:MAG: hypothetical protein ACFFBP_00790 [Promethearchaeota archaeon]
MSYLKRYKIPLITIFVVTFGLILMMTFGYAIGILSGAPDGLERVMNDIGAEEPVSPFAPLLGFIENDYVIAILGISLIISITVVSFYLIGFIKKKRINNQI